MQTETQKSQINYSYIFVLSEIRKKSANKSQIFGFVNHKLSRSLKMLPLLLPFTLDRSRKYKTINPKIHE